MTATASRKNPRAATEAKLRAAGAKAGKAAPAKAADDKAAKAAAAAKLREVDALRTREQALADATRSQREAYRATILGRFEDAHRVEADDLRSIYPSSVKTLSNRVNELNATLRTAQCLGKAQAVRLLDAVETYGESGRLRDDWSKASALARRLYRDVTAVEGTDKARAAVDAVNEVVTAMIEAQTATALRDAEASARKAADKAQKEADKAHAYAAKVSDDPVASKAAERNAREADKRLTAAQEKHEAAKAKLPKPAPAAPRAPERVVQDVKVAMGDESLPLAALATMARDLAARFRTAGKADIADAIGRAVESIK